MKTIFDIISFWALGIVLGCLFAYAVLGGIG
jgi:hypothetical protein